MHFTKQVEANLLSLIFLQASSSRDAVVPAPAAASAVASNAARSELASPTSVILEGSTVTATSTDDATLEPEEEEDDEDEVCLLTLSEPVICLIL